MSIQRLLDIRLEELKQDVAKVGRAVDVAAQRHQLVRTMKDYLHIRGAQSVVGPLHRARLALGTLQELLWQDDPETASLLQDNGVDLEEIIIDLERVASGLLTTQHALEKAETRVELTDAMQDALKGN